ncbi:MAG TPA: RNA polymerase sigma factor [Gemmataceae bacterium]|nr:RNA polymerase sigma factor [Gemmataceae bacterium]
MKCGPLSDVLRHIRRIALTAETADLEDGPLLQRFLEHGEEAAFEALLRRHGPMVLGVCRRLLRDPHDIEDAFQATFLVLLRKAAGLGKRELVANWLYGVAHRTALKARALAARRNVRTRPLTDVPAEEAESEIEWNDLRPVLDEEIQRLPNQYRVPVVLCYLEGKTFEEAARLLGWPAGTVSGRLARARQLLRARLTRRGLGLTAGLLATALTDAASAALPISLKVATVRAAMTFMANGTGAAGLIPTSVVVLMEGVVHAMFMTKVKVAASLVLIVSALSGGAGVVTYQKLAAQTPGQQPANSPMAVAVAQQETVEEKADRLSEQATPAMTPDYKIRRILEASKLDTRFKELMKNRIDAAKTELKARYREFCAGRGTLDILFGASRRLLEAERDLTPRKADQVAAWETHLQRMQDIYAINLARFEAGRISIQDLAQADFYRLDAEIGLEDAKADGKHSKPSSN